MHWALLSDLHIPANPADTFRGFKPQDNLKRIVPDILKANHQGALVCGDVARLTGLTADYEAARALLQPLSEKMPIALALGSHDHRGNFLGVFGRSQNGIQHVDQKHVLVVESAACASSSPTRSLRPTPPWPTRQGSARLARHFSSAVQ